MSLKLGYKQTEIEVIPDNWQTKTLGSLLDYEQPTPFLVISTDYLEFSSVPVLTAGKTFILGYTDEEHGVYKSLPVILFDDFTTACQWVDFPFKVKSSAAKILSGRVGVSDTKFMHEYLSRLSYVPSDHQRHWISVFSSIEVIVPPVKEQKAIAEALSDVDALIDSLEALLTKKRNIKTGVMQELLTGRTRLPGFSDDWHEVRLEDFADCFDHLRIPLNESERLTRIGDYPYCGANGVLGFIDKYLIDDEMVLIAEDGGYFDEFATRPIAYKMSGKYWVNNHAHVLKAKPSQDNNYLYYSLVHKDVTPYLASGTRAKLNKSEMWKIEIRAPKSKSEQEAIAAVLSDIDDEIEALEKRLAKTRDLKQGMAQELLTGRTRLV